MGTARPDALMTATLTEQTFFQVHLQYGVDEASIAVVLQPSNSAFQVKSHTVHDHGEGCPWKETRGEKMGSLAIVGNG